MFLQLPSACRKVILSLKFMKVYYNQLLSAKINIFFYSAKKSLIKCTFNSLFSYFFDLAKCIIAPFNRIGFPLGVSFHALNWLITSFSILTIYIVKFVFA